MTRRRHLLLLCFLMGLHCFGTLLAQTKSPLQANIENIIYYDAKVNFQDTPGFIIGVIAGDTTYTFAYGSQQKTASIPITEQTIFELGGASKLLTASLVDKLVQDGQMHYDSTLYHYIGGQKEHAPTLYELLVHTSGLPRLPNDFGRYEKDIDNPYAYYPKQALSAYYHQRTSYSKKGKYDYSNLAYALLELAIEQQTGLSFEAAIQQYLLQSKGLESTTFTKSSKAICQGYNTIGHPVALWQSPAFGAAIGATSNLADLLHFLHDQIHATEFDHLHQKVQATLVEKGSYTGIGWHVIQPKKYYDIIAHSGATAGHRVFIGFVKETKTGVIVLCNSKTGTNGLGYLILKMLNNHWKLTKEQRRQFVRLP